MTYLSDDIKQKPLRKRGVARREAILHAASDAFLEHGYEKATMSDIVGRAGGSKALLYEQFGDKAGLFRAMMQHKCEEILIPLASAIDDLSSPRATLTAFGRGFVSSLSSPELIGLQRVAVAEGWRNPEISDTYFALGHDAAYTRLSGYLGNVAAVSLDERERLRLAVLFFAMIQGDAIERLLVGTTSRTDETEIDEYISIGVDWLLSRIWLSG